MFEHILQIFMCSSYTRSPTKKVELQKRKRRQRERARSGTKGKAVYSVNYGPILHRLRLTTRHQAGNAYMSETDVLYKMRRKRPTRACFLNFESTFRLLTRAYICGQRHITGSGNAVQHPWIWGTHGCGFFG